jgi:hypothetical protein
MRELKKILTLLIITATFQTMMGTTLDRDSNITISFKGPFGNTDSILKETLTKYIFKKLNRDKLSGDGEQVLIELCCTGATWRDLDLTNLKSIQELDSFTIDTRQTGKISITGKTALGASYGLFYFLESHLDVFWLFPGTLGECIEPVDKIDIPAVLIKKNPKWTRQEYRSGLSQLKRMFFWSFDYQKNLKLHHLFGVSHNMIKVFPEEESLKNHPEIFPLKNNGKPFIPSLAPTKTGRYGSERSWHPCYSNPKTVEVATQKAIDFFKKEKGLAFSLGISDGKLAHCQCVNCASKKFPAPYYEFVNKVARNVKKYYPPFMIGVLAYGSVQTPSKNLKLEDNVLVNCTGQFEKWRGLAKNLSVYQYQYGWGYWVPNFPLKALVHNAKVFHKDGVVGYRAEIYPLWAFDAPKVYILSNLLWDSDFDTGKALERYCRAGFGRAWKVILDFYRLWLNQHNHGEVGDDGLIPTWSTNTFRNSTEQFSSLSPSLYINARSYIMAAKQLAQSTKVKKRLEMLDTFFSYSETYYNTFLASQDIFTYSENKNWSEKQKRISSLINKRHQLIATMGKHKEWFLGTKMTPQKILDGKTWETRWEWSLDYEGESALLTSRYQAEKANYKSTPLKFDIMMTPWVNYYNQQSFSRLKAKPVHGGASFYLTPQSNSLSHISSETSQKRTPEKKYWFRGNLKVEQGQYYLFKINLEGKSGTVDIYIANENDCGKKVHLIQKFAKNSMSFEKQLVLTPTDFWGHTKPVKHVSVCVIFTPSSNEGIIEGTCTIDRIEYNQEK